jgi:hypothetical protein
MSALTSCCQHLAEKNIGHSLASNSYACNWLVGFEDGVQPDFHNGQMKSQTMAEPSSKILTL